MPARYLLVCALVVTTWVGLGVAPARDASLARALGSEAPPSAAVAQASPSSSTGPPSSSAARVVRVGIYENEPKVFSDAAGKPAGFFVDLLDAVAEAEGWRVVWVPMEWDAGLQALAKGRLDLMPDVAYTAERAALFDFNAVSVIESWSQLYSSPDVSLEGFESLDGRRVAVLSGSVQQEEFQRIVRGLGIQVEVVPVESYREAFSMARDGDVDAAITNRFFGDRYYREYGLNRSDVVFSIASLYFATAKGVNGELLSAIDRHLRRWREESSSPYYAAVTRWLQQPSTTATRYRVSRWLAWTLGIIAALLVLTAAGVVLLRWQVKVRTRHLTEANEALTRERRRLEDIIEFLPDATFVVDEEKRVVAWNRACEAMTGVKKEAVLGRGDQAYSEPFFKQRRSLLIDLVDEPPPEVEGTHASLQEAGQTVSTETFIPHFRGGEGAYLWAAAAPLYDQEGKRSGAIEVVRDITERKQTQDELERHRLHLEELVASRTAELAVEKERAEAADRIKSAFLATMSHELRTPLNSIIGFTGIILQELAGPLNDEQKKQLGMVRDAARHLLALINDVLDISKIEAGQMTVASERFDLAESIAKVAEIVRPLADKKGLDLEVQVAPEIGAVVSDPRRVEQVLLNLLNNAVKFTERGAVMLTADTATDADHDGASAVRMAIADTGIGIKPEDLDKLFLPFRQLDSGLARRHEGTGLGLAICLRLAELLGGRIDVTSEWGKGSVFSFTLPVKEATET